VPDHETRADQDSTGRIPGAPATDAVETTESYETEEGVVFYDAENPLAWIKTETVFDLEEMA
jgi:hypothetical protein